MTQIIEQFFVPVKKVKRGDPIPEVSSPKQETTKPEKFVHPKLREWLKKNARKGQ